MPPGDDARLRHILKAAEDALELVAGKDIEDLLDDRGLAWAVLWLLTMIGEAANHVTWETRERIPLPWSEMVGMRNRLIHGYFDLNIGIVHRTVVVALPQIVETLQRHLTSG